VAVVEARTALGAIVLLPLAVQQGQVGPVLRKWRPLLVYSVAELGVPWFLLSSAEERLPSSLSGLLVATVPLIGLVLSAVLGWHPSRVDKRELLGLVVGLVGVGVVLGLDVGRGNMGSVAEVLVVAVGYATGPLLVSRYLNDVSSLALAAVSLVVAAVGYLPGALLEMPDHVPPATALVSLVVLGLVCTAVAFVAFFELIKAMAPTKAMLITYFNPVVAVLLGVALLGETFKATTAVGFTLILAGSWLSTASGGARSRPRPNRDPSPETA
jgi:drug/metabolite transporter (DMT)-like permease